MNLLDKRPLSTILAIMLGGLVFYAYADKASTARMILLVCCTLLAIAFAIFKIFFKKRRLILVVSACTLLLTTVFSHIYFDLWFKPHERFEDEVSIEGMVSSLSVNDYYTFRATVKTTSINGESFSRYKLILDLSEEEAEYLSVGAVVSFKGVLKKIESYSDSFDSEKYYASLGYHATCELKGSITVTEYTDGGLEERLTHWRDLLSRRAISVSDSESGSFLAGLLLGERGYLDGKVGFDFTRSGVSHILALSGMHFVILGLGIEKLLEIFNVNKRWRKAAIIVFAIAYTALTGATPSVLRSGIMLVVASLLFLVCGSRDSLTNMMISCALICFVTPFSVYSVSLWLSAFSTFGIIAMGEFYEEKEHKRVLARLGSWIWSALIATFFAMGAAFCIFASVFSGISNMMIVGNLLCAPLSDIYLYIGSAAIVVGNVIPVGKLLIPLFKLISYLIDLCASPRLGYVSIDFTAVRIIIVIFIVLYFAFTVLKIEHKRTAVGILMVIFISVFAVSTALTYASYNEDAVIYRNSDGADNVIVKSNGELMIIDSANYSKGTAYDSVYALSEERIFYIDKYVVTHYSKRLDEMLVSVAQSVKTESMYLPYPANEDEIAIADSAIERLERHGVDVRFYANEAVLKHGEYEFIRHYSVPYGTGTAGSAYTLTSQDASVLYLCSGILSGSTKEMATKLIAENTTVIFGCHGKKYSNLTYLDFCSENAKQIVLSGSNIALTQLCHMYYDEKGCEIMSHPLRAVLYVE